MQKMQKKRLPSSQRVQIPNSYERRRRVSITEHLERRVSYTQRILRRPLPIRVLVLQRREYLVQMVIVRVPHVRPQYSIAARLVEAELQVLGAEIEVGLGARETEHEVAVGEIG